MIALQNIIIELSTITIWNWLKISFYLSVESISQFLWKQNGLSSNKSRSVTSTLLIILTYKSSTTIIDIIFRHYFIALTVRQLATAKFSGMVPKWTWHVQKYIYFWKHSVTAQGYWQQHSKWKCSFVSYSCDMDYELSAVLRSGLSGQVTLTSSEDL